MATARWSPAPDASALLGSRNPTRIIAKPATDEVIGFGVENARYGGTTMIPTITILALMTLFVLLDSGFDAGSGA